MSDEREERGGGFPWLLLLLMPVLYVLSVGPVVWAFTASGLAPSSWIGQVIDLFYTPVLWASDWTDTSDVFTQYLKWWRKLAP